MSDPTATYTFTAAALSGTALTPPEPPARYPGWKIARNCAVALGAVALGAGTIIWVGNENDKQSLKMRVSSDEQERGGRG